MPARSTKPPERFGLDRLTTPIGIALLVTDAEGAACARLGRLRAPHARAVAPALRRRGSERSACADGDADGAVGLFRRRSRPALGRSHGASPARRSSKGSGPRSRKILAGTTMSYGALAAKDRYAQSHSCRRPCQRLKPDQRGAALSPPDRRGWLAGEIWRRARSGSAGCCGMRAVEMV